MKRLLLPTLVATSLCAIAPVPALATSDSESPCTDAPTAGYSIAFTAWGRSSAARVTGDTEAIEWWESWDPTYTKLEEANDASYVPTSTARRGDRETSLHLRWAEWGGCYYQQDITGPAGRGNRPRLSISGTSARDTGGANATITIKSAGKCATTRPGSAFIQVRRGARRWVSRRLKDGCTVRGFGREWRLSRGMSAELYRPASEVWLWIDESGPARERVTVRLRAGGRTTSQVGYHVTRIDRPDRKVWTGTDEYWNWCVNHGERVYAQGGRYYCWRYGVDSVRLKRVR